MADGAWNHPLGGQAAELWVKKWGGEMYPYRLTVVEFPVVFGSTAGPFGGVGGASMTPFQITVFTDGSGRAIAFCGGRFWKTSQKFRWHAEGF